ncbi:tetratricopeptide repeat protein [Ktedonospora formicarum]|uniref:MalT-like TPR region domain-containing protein n=1 Tax=Ktedonospora formicarum TaxID=2778364 RepID=A0A8J3I5P7_9CHLR|nr:tetratricopeptide repeat protein [Ktedonospora formicarum]GHO46368.1 hypothetical protein KSX_45310 [Ktedonospora formicarum]
MSLSSEALSERYASSLQTISEIANAYYFQGRIDEALRLFQGGEQWLAAPEAASRDKLYFLLKYGQFLIHYYFLTNKMEEIMSSVVRQALQAAEASQDKAALAIALYLLGQVHYYRNLYVGVSDYGEAREYLERASALSEQIGDLFKLSESLFYTGLTYDRESHSEQAQSYYQRALELAEQHGNKWAASEALRHLTDHTEGEQRLHYALRSLELREEMGFKRGLPPAQLLVSDVYLDLGDLKRALEYCQQAEQLATEMGLQIHAIWGLLTYGDIASKREQVDQARDYYQQALTMANEFNNAFGIALANEKLKKLASEV